MLTCVFFFFFCFCPRVTVSLSPLVCLWVTELYKTPLELFFPQTPPDALRCLFSSLRGHLMLHFSSFFFSFVLMGWMWVFSVSMATEDSPLSSGSSSLKVCLFFPTRTFPAEMSFRYLWLMLITDLRKKLSSGMFLKPPNRNYAILCCPNI